MPPELETISWQVPKWEAAASEKIGWVESQIKEGEGWLSGQPSYKNLNQNLRVFDGIFKDKSKSSLVTNELRYSVNKFCTTMAEVREIAGFSSDVPTYKPIAEMLTKVSKAVYLESDFPLQILKVLQYATVMGCGYLWSKVRASEYGYGPREMVFDALGLLDVIPTQVPSRTNDVQDAYSITVYDYCPVAEASARFPLFQGQLQTVGRNNYKSLIQAQRQDFAATWRYGQVGETQSKSFGNLYTEIRYTFVRDLRINTTGLEMKMGDEGTTWFYKVPFLGQEIFGGMKNGQPFMRPAMVEDCRIYPNLRLIITSSGLDKVMYDGTSFDWDPKMPVIQYTVDDVAWEPSGRSLVGDVASIQTTIRKHERKVDQTMTAKKNPPMGYDIDTNGGAKIEHFDLFEEDVRLGLAGGEPQKTFQSILPDTITVDSIDFTWLKYLSDKLLAQLGLNDVGNLANMKLNLANDTADKMLESIGPIARGIAMRIEKANKKLGERMKYLIPQWFDAARLIEYVGPDGIAKEMFDYNPDDMVPSHLPDEFVDGKLYPTTPSMYDRLTRAKYFVRKLRLISVPNTLLKITQMQEQLKYLQLKRTPDCPISWETTFEKLDIANPKDEMKKYFKEQTELTNAKLIGMAMAQEEMKKLGLQPPEEGGGGGGKGGGKGGAPHAGGRPPSGQKGPRLAQKGGAGGQPRSVVKES